MQKVTVSKSRLLETLHENRDKHREMFLTAQTVFRAKVIETLDARLAEARKGGKIQLYITLPEPEDYTDSFDHAIAMVEWEEGNSISLSEQDFQKYVLNNWDWARAFAKNTASYLASNE